MISIDTTLCKACGICGNVCPRHIPETIQETEQKSTRISKNRSDLCMECGHCEAVCPNGAIKLEFYRNEQFPKLDSVDFDGNQLLELVKQRRSIRRYRNKPVPRDILDQIINVSRYSPTGTGRRVTGVIIIESSQILEKLSALVYEVYEDLGKGLRNPIAKQIIKRRIGTKLFATLTNFVMPGMRWYIKWYKEGKSNEIFRDCPVLILFHNPISEPMASENCLIAAFNAHLGSQTFGIGSCMNDLIPPACNRSFKARELLKLHKDREIYASLTLGYPKHKFKRSIPREFVEVQYL